ncbi:unnamed protein product [Larinioides sclopetarius]|uniref:Uncharacterized protein n=1 Tax=Larinioides sclopetarius TaxID=280406 RepID=A0AAV2ARC0_9ARAC
MTIASEFVIHFNILRMYAILFAGKDFFNKEILIVVKKNQKRFLGSKDDQRRSGKRRITKERISDARQKQVLSQERSQKFLKGGAQAKDVGGIKLSTSSLCPLFPSDMGKMLGICSEGVPERDDCRDDQPHGS